MAKKDSKNLKKLEQETAELKARQMQEQEKLRKEIQKLTPEELQHISVGKYSATLQALDIVQEILQGKRKPERLPGEVLERKQIALLPFELLTSDIAMDKGSEKKGQAVAIVYAPELDPSKPQFDAKAYREELQELAPDIDKATQLISKYAGDMAKIMVAAIPQTLKDAAAELLANLPDVVNNLRKQVETIAGIDWELIDYIGQVIDSPQYAKLKAKSEAEHWTIGDLQKAAEWQDILQEAKKRRADAEKTSGKQLHELDGEKVKNTEWAISKISRELWDSTRGQVEGQYTMIVNTLPQQRDAGTVVTINAEALPKELRELPEYDRRVWTATISLWVAGCRCVTADNIYYAMGNNSKLNQRDRKKIDTAMYKMGLMKAQIDNVKEADSSNYPVYYGGQFYILPNEKIWAINTANGQEKQAYLLPSDKPRLLHYAEIRGQVRKLRREVLCTPTNQNDSGIRLDDYIIDRIIDIRDGRANSNKILYSTMFDLLKTRTDHRQAVIEKIHAVLDYFKEIHFIADWEEAGKKENPGVYIYISGQQDALPQK